MCFLDGYRLVGGLVCDCPERFALGTHSQGHLLAIAGAVPGRGWGLASQTPGVCFLHGNHFPVRFVDEALHKISGSETSTVNAG